MLSNSELKDLEDFAKNEYLYDSINYFKQLILLAVQEIRNSKQSETVLSTKQVPLGEITQEMLNQYYVYLETPNGNKVVNRILPTGNDRVVLVYVDGGEYIKFRTTLALVTSVPK